MKAELNILAIETASEACSASLLKKGKKNASELFSRVETTPRQHAKLILSMLGDVLEEGSISLNEVDVIAFSRGPGAFTGLRIAAGVAQGIALSIDVPVAPVSTLAALAWQSNDLLIDLNKKAENQIIAVAMDARMGEVYWGFFRFSDLSKVELIGEEKVTKPEELLKETLLLAETHQDSQIICLGSGWDIYEETLLGNSTSKSESNNMVHLKNAQTNAKDIAELALDLIVAGKVVKPEDAQPVYIRNDVAKKSSKL